MPTAYPTPDADEEMDEMTDELRTLESRTRALAARVEALTAERDTARASSDRWHGVAHRMEEERDAAVKAKEEWEQLANEANRRWRRAGDERDALRAQVEQMCGALREWATPPTGMGASLHAVTWPALTASARRRMLRLAALSPSPASPAVTGEVLPPETYPQWKAGGWGPDTVDGEVARKALPEPASGVAEGEKCARCQGEGKIANSDEGEPWSAWSSLPPGSDIAVRLGLVKPIDCPACGGAGTDEATR